MTAFRQSKTEKEYHIKTTVVKKRSTYHTPVREDGPWAGRLSGKRDTEGSFGTGRLKRAAAVSLTRLVRVNRQTEIYAL